MTLLVSGSPSFVIHSLRRRRENPNQRCHYEGAMLFSARGNPNRCRHSEGVSPKNLLLSSRWIFGPGLVSGLFQDLLLSSSRWTARPHLFCHPGEPLVPDSFRDRFRVSNNNCSLFLLICHSEPPKEAWESQPTSSFWGFREKPVRIPTNVVILRVSWEIRENLNQCHSEGFVRNPWESQPMSSFWGFREKPVRISSFIFFISSF